MVFLDDNMKLSAEKMKTKMSAAEVAPPAVSWIRTGIGFLKEYCVNSSMAGVSYIANSHLHFSERLFWLMCVSMSACGSYYLIMEFDRDFESKAVSIAYEFLKPSAKIHFPTTCICPSRKTSDSTADPLLEAYVKNLQNMYHEQEYNYDVELYLTLLLYPEGYHYNAFITKCKPYLNCENCAKCPEGNYTQLAKQLFSKCETFFIRCTWYGKPFDCCKYFRPLQTTLGICFIMNSIHNNKPGSEFWFHNVIDSNKGSTVLHVETSAGLYSNFLDPEGLPNMVLSAMHEKIQEKGTHKEIYIYKEDMVNDADIREISPEARKCRFPDEVMPNSIYDHYSFSGCITDCIRRKHIDLCNCTLYLLVVRDDDRTPVCGLEGNMCMDSHDMVLTTTSQMQLTNDDFECNCLPSCNEADMRIVYSGRADMLPNSSRMLTVRMADVPGTNYRRQAVRTRLDVVVTIGGILGLFMGVSILSGIEFLYFFSIRLYSNSRWNLKVTH